MALTNDDILVVQSNDDGKLYKLSIEELSNNISPDTEIPTSETPPSDAVDGSLWFNTEDGRLYVYYDDGNTEQWVDASPDTFNPNAVPDNDNPAYQPGTIDDRYVRLNGTAAPQEITGSGGLSVAGGVNVTGGDETNIDTGIGIFKDRLALIHDNKPVITIGKDQQAYGLYANSDIQLNQSGITPTLFSLEYKGTGHLNTATYNGIVSKVINSVGSNVSHFRAQHGSDEAVQTEDNIRVIGFDSRVSTAIATGTNSQAFNFYAFADAPNFLKGDTYIGGNTTRNTRELWESLLTEEQKEQLSAGTLAIPANVSTPGDGSFVRQWWYDQQDAETQAELDAGTLKYPEHLAAATFTDTFDLGDNAYINLLSNGDAEFTGGNLYVYRNIGKTQGIDIDTSSGNVISSFSDDANQKDLIIRNTSADKSIVLESDNVGINGSSVFSADALIYGVTVGRGGGSKASNTAIGNSALSANTTGDQNSAFGRSALKANTEGTNNAAVGNNALLQNTTGNNNTAIGNNALYNNDEGGYNTAVGRSCLFGNTIGNFNTAVGQSCMLGNTEGNQNTAVGREALKSNITGSNNTAIGKDAGYYIEGSNNTILGAYEGTAADATLNDTVIISAGTTERMRIDSAGDAEFYGSITADNVTFNLEPDNDAYYIVTTYEDVEGNPAEKRVYNGPKLDVKAVILELQQRVADRDAVIADFTTRLAALEADHATLMGNSNEGY